MKKKILVIDDERNIVELIRINLENSGYDVFHAYTGMEGIMETNSSLPDLILLDLMLPDIDGLQICRMLRRNIRTRNIPIIMLTARSEEMDKVEGLSLGADDYVTKPFGVRELEARIQSVLRRTDQADKTPPEQGVLNTLKYQDLELDILRHEVRREGRLLDLTLTEFKILRLLMVNGSRVTSREEISEEIGIDRERTDTRTIDVHIRNIRRKLEKSQAGDYIETVRGLGYKLN